MPDERRDILTGVDFLARFGSSGRSLFPDDGWAVVPPDTWTKPVSGRFRYEDDAGDGDGWFASHHRRNTGLASA